MTIDDRLLGITLAQRGVLAEIEELQHERILDDVGRRCDLLAFARQREDLLGVAMLREPIEQQGPHLALELADRPALAGGFDLVEGKGLSIAAARRLVAREARIAAERETRAVVKQLATRKAFTSLSKAEQERVLRIVYWEKQRQFFRGYLKAARAEQRAVRQALTKAKPGEQAALEARRAAAAMGEDIAKAEPVAGQLPRNHEYAGHEFPRSQLPPQYRKQGLRFKDTGHPDFEPYAKVLPNGQKKVRIAYTGSWTGDFAAANKAAKLENTPRGYSWHHDESDMGMMYLVPDDLHQAVRHSGGVAEYRHRHGVTKYD